MQAYGLILAGGKSTRMEGIHKGDLFYRRQTFLERAVQELGKETEEIWISYGEEDRGRREGCQIIMDEFPGCGPIGGIHSGLKNGKRQWAMVAACDMPFLEISLYRFLFDKLEQANKARQPEYMGAVPFSEGKIHPLAAIYHKGLWKALERQIKKGKYRLTDALSQERILYVDLTKEEALGTMLQNINTTVEYKKLNREDYPSPDGAG
ncbi:MAG: molybdenum cofactor guanylyltransferase [Lachnospiraceae bacterium]|nr:molybdenum cofactor guanylyltransferase [Lachnospiraceae bacterium]MCI9184512.1 molybdenum cofactor guanylyltransferase [Lachnospiraceae bacterium]